MITREIGRAMATQVKEVNENPARLLERIQELMVENDRLRQQIENQRRIITQHQHTPTDEPNVQKVLRVSGRPIGNQSALARALHVGPDRVSKWHKERRLQFYVDAAGIEFFFLDQGKPTRKRRGI